MAGCTGRRYIIEILLQTALNTIQPINYHLEDLIENSHSLRLFRYLSLTRISSSWTLYQKTYLGLVQIESVCRRQVLYYSKNDIVFYMVENIVGGGENARGLHYLRFRNFFENNIYLKIVKNWYCIFVS